MNDWPLVAVALGVSLTWAATLVMVTRDVTRGWAVVMTGLIDHTTCIAVARTGGEPSEDLVGAGGFVGGDDDGDDDKGLEHGESYTPTCKPRKSRRLGF